MKPKIHTLILSLGLCLPLAVQADAAKPYVQTRSLNMEMAHELAVQSARACAQKGYQVAVSVVDRNGHLLALVRDPLAGPHTIEVSQRKAFTAATYQSSTTAMMQSQHLRFTPGVLLLGGGLPIKLGGHFYGAVAVSGAPAKKTAGDVDEECAQAGIEKIREALEFAE